MLDNVNHISGVWGTQKGSVTQSLAPPSSVHMTRCQMRVSAFRHYIYIFLPHPHTHTQLNRHVYVHTYLLVKLKNLTYFKCSGCSVR